MFDTILNKVISEEFQQKNREFVLTHGFYRFSDFHNTADPSKRPIDLGKSILIIKSIEMLFNESPGSWLSNVSFFEVESNREKIDYTPFLDCYSIESGSNVLKAKAEYPSVHDTGLYVRYDLSTFVTNDILNVYNAALRYILLTPKY